MKTKTMQPMVKQLPPGRDTVDYSIKRGDAVVSDSWGLTPLEVIDVNHGLRAVAVRLGPTGDIVIWHLATVRRPD